MLQKIYRAGIFMYAALFILALVFYKERIIILDDAFYLFDIIQKDSFSIQHYRFISIVTEVFPLLANKLSFSLDGVIMSYSAGFIIYYFICYLLCGWMKEYRLGIALLLVNILFSTHTFYWMLSELTLGMTIMIVLLAFINSRTKQSNNIATALVLLIVMPTIAFAHMLIMIPLSYGVLYLFINDKERMTFKKGAMIGSLFVAIVIIKSVFFKEQYDSNAMEGLKNFKTLFPNYFNLHSNRVFLKNCLLKYQWIPICFLAISIVYIQAKEWLKLGLFLAYTIGFMALVNISYYSSGTQEFYIENLYMPLGFLLGLPLIYDVWPVLSEKKWGTGLAVLFFITCLIRIYWGHGFYTDRLNWQRDFLKQHKDEKLIVNAPHLPMEILLMPWGSPYEFWLLSTTEQKQTASIVFAEHLGDITWAANIPDGFLTTWGSFPYKELNKKYFMFTDSTSVYRVVQ